MNDIRINGLGKMTGGEFGNIRVDGLGECEGNIVAQNVDIDGKFKCTGSIRAEVLDCDGLAEFYSDVYAKRLDVDGCLNVKNGTKLEAEEIDCDGSIKVNGQISADRIKVDGAVKAKEIVGDYVYINSGASRLSHLFVKNFSQAELIEATTIELYGVTAGTVNGCDMKIGAFCKIDNLDCSGALFIDKTAQVKNITGNYTMKE